MDADFDIVDGLHRSFIEPGLYDEVGDVALGLAANVCHVDAEHLQGVRLSIIRVEKDTTEAWHPWEGNVESSCQLFAFAAVDDDCRVDVEPTIVVELDNGEHDDK